MSLEDIFFLGFSFLTLAGALMAVWLKNVFHNALALILSLFGVACIFIYLGAEFLAVMEVIIYIGAIAVAIIFAIMLSHSLSGTTSARSVPKRLKAGGVSLLLFVSLARMVQSTPWPLQGVQGDYSIRALGKALLTVYALPFEAISLILLVAIIGSLVLSSSRETSS